MTASKRRGPSNALRNGTRLTRRHFLAAGAAIAIPYFVPGAALGAGAVAASGRITLGVIGTGRRGTQDMLGLMACPDVQVAALSDCRRPRLEAAHQKVVSFYSQKTSGGTYKACDTYPDFRDLIARSDVDAILVAPPDHWHGIVATRALAAGKDLYCEKPIGLTVAQCKAIRDAVTKHGRVFQTGTQQRSDANFRHACQLARNGYLGKIRLVEVAVPAGGNMPVEPSCPVPEGFDYDMWTGPAKMSPFDAKRCEWLAMYWISDYCVGFICNWGVHHLDIAQWGVPEITTEPFELEGKAIFPKGGMCDTAMIWNTDFRYASGLRMNFTSASDMSWTVKNLKEVTEHDLAGMGKLNEQGCRFVGDEGWVHVNRKGIKAEPASLLQVKLKPAEVHLHASDDHYADFVKSVKARTEPVAPVDAGHRASVLGCVADITVRLGRKVKWHPAEDRFLDDSEATAMLSRPMRPPWSM